MRGSERKIEFKVTMGKHTLALGSLLLTSKYKFVTPGKNVDS